MTVLPRRRFRYSLRTLVVVVTVFCITAGWRFNVAAKHQALYSRLLEQHVNILKLPDERDSSSDAEYYWCRTKEALGFERVYDVWVSFNVEQPRPKLRDDLMALRDLHPDARFWGLFGGCGQMIDLDQMEK